jgi:argininosuccinate synthase
MTTKHDDAKKRVLLAYSGGLDTSFLAAWLTHEKGYEVTTLTVDCGGLNDADRDALAERSRWLGAVEHRTIEARGELFDRVLRWLIAGNVRRGETYPLCVGAERGLQAEVLARVAHEASFDAVAHGCTGAGNDQVRFESALAVVAEGIETIAPIRDRGLSRNEERAWLGAHGFRMPATDSLYSVNAGLWGLTIGGGELLVEDRALPEDVWRWTQPCLETAAAAGVLVTFDEGVPIALDGEVLEPVELIEALNVFAGSAGVGRGYHLGDTILGTKGRIAYEAPAADVLLVAHRELEKLVLTEEQRFWKDHLGDVYGRKLHQGQFHEPLLRDIEALFASAQERVCGEVDVAFRGGQSLVQSVSSPYSMLSASDAQYGERAATGADPTGAVWLARTMAEPSRLAQRASLGPLRPFKSISPQEGAESADASEDAGTLSTDVVTA